MAKKTAKTPDPITPSAPVPQPAPKRRAPARKAAAPPVDVATVSGTEPIATATDMGAANGDTRSSAGDGDYQPSHSEIAEAAYFRHLNRGGGGDEFDDWVEAERELRERRR